MGNELVAYSELEKKAMAVAKSGLFGVKTPEQAIALFLVAEAEGIPVMQAVLDYHIIDNKPSLKSDAMLRRFQASGGIVKWLERSDKKVAAQFSHPSSPDPILIDWDMERATKAGLSTKTQKDGKPNMWAKFPRQMLTARVISEGIRATAPGAASGIYTPEEVADFEPSKPTKEEVKPVSTVQDAEIVAPASGPGSGEVVQAEEPEAPKPLSNTTLANFQVARSALNGEFERILKEHGYASVEEIKDNEKAKIVLRAMRIAFEKQKAVAHV